MTSANRLIGAALAAGLALAGGPAAAGHAFLDVREFVKGESAPSFDVGPVPLDALEDTVRFALWFPKAKAAAGLPAGCVLAGTFALLAPELDPAKRVLFSQAFEVAAGSASALAVTTRSVALETAAAGARFTLEEVSVECTKDAPGGTLSDAVLGAVKLSEAFLGAELLGGLGVTAPLFFADGTPAHTDLTRQQTMAELLGLDG